MNLFQLEIETGNAAFREDPGELGRLLRKIAARVDDGATQGAIIDANGKRERIVAVRYTDGTEA